MITPAINHDQAESLTLTNCDREPIHIPGAIQPHGLLFVLQEPDFTITHISQNSLDILGIPAPDLLGQPLVTLMQPPHLEAIRGCLAGNFEHINPLPLTLTLNGTQSLAFNGIVHRNPQDQVVLELEPRPSGVERDFFQFYHQVKHTLAALRTIPTLSGLCDLIVQETQRLTGFDRVMIYRFDQEGAGEVIAEAKQPDQEAFLGLRYPDSDIPKQAKHLYTVNWLRLIPDVDYEPVSLLGLEDSPAPTANSDAIAPVAPLDMSHCVLRAVSPIHIEYLKNMGVVASMSISLLHNQRLWGLIACHHNTPRFVPYETRAICEFLGQLMSTELGNKTTNENLDYQLHLRTVQSQLIERLTRSTDVITDLLADQEMLLQVTGATGAAICNGEDITLVGQTPSLEDMRSLIEWVSNQIQNDQFATHTLPHLYRPAAAYQQVASGLLVMAISRLQQRYVLWFRPEVIQTVTWAGNPDKPKRVEEDGSLTIFPRQSFEAWQQLVQGQSLPWLPCEIDAVMELRKAIVEVVLRQADELAQINLELQRSNNELDAFAYIASHDLKEPLRGIHNYSTFLLEDYQNTLDQEGAEKLQTLIRLTKRMESLIDSLLKFSRLGRQELQLQAIDLNQLLHEIIQLFAMNPEWVNCQVRIPQPLPVVYGDRPALEELFTNLISNAFKYNDRPDKWVEIGSHTPTSTDSEQSTSPMVTLYVQDNGIGIRDKHLETIFRIFKRLHAPGKYGGGAGAGLTIVKKIVERHGGQIWVESTYGQGTTFWFTLLPRS